MSNPAAVLTRVFRFGLRFSVIKSNRSCCAVQTKALYHSFIVKNFNSYNYNLPRNLVKDFTRRNQATAMSALSPKDPASYSRPEIATIKHVGLNLNVDFDKKVLSGAALLQFNALQDVDEVILDMSTQTIQSVEMENGTALKYKIDGHIANFGSKLTITLPRLVPASGNLSQKQETKPASSRSASEPKTSPLMPRQSKTLSKHSTIIEGDDFLYKLAPSTHQTINKRTFVLIPVDEGESDSCICFECESEDSDEEIAVKKEKKSKDSVRVPSFSKGTDVHDADEVINTSRRSTRERPENAPSNTELKERPSNSGTSTMNNVTVEQRENTVKITLSLGPEPENDPNKCSKNCVNYRSENTGNDSKDMTPRPENVEEEQVSESFRKDSKSQTLHDRSFTIKIKYTTDPAASALQWLEPSQTSGKKHPYLFSQCQPIHARSILPCQDTPAVKFTYDAEITAPEPFTVLMSALTKDRQATKAIFHQPVPLPSYLIALAVGVLEKRSIGPRTTVWTEKEEIDRSAWEFADTEKYLQAAERLCGPYVWTQYDLLVLPPSFPYGGMENPCLTFVTPTLLAGDRSQADVIVHEIMHSWTGNLVTNRNFEHFWLNEGFTVFLERKVASSLIADPVEAKKSRDFHSLLGLQELSEAVKDELGVDNPLTQMVVNLTGVHPDDAFSTVPYEKGSLFLRYLEDLIGIEVFDEFLRSYLATFQKQSLDTDEFKAYLLGYFNGKPAADKLAHVNWTAWLYTPGMPPIIPNYDTSMTKAVTNLLAMIDQNGELSPNDVKDFNPHQLINFLQEMIDRKPLPAEKLENLGALYKVADSHNSEIRYRWLRLCVRSKILRRLPEVFEFVNSQGRMKYVRPLYRDMYAWEEVRDQAITNFRENERYMMHVSAYTIRKDLHLSENMIQQQ